MRGAPVMTAGDTALAMVHDTDSRAPSVADRILGETIALFEEGGPDAVAVREIARRARVSLRDIFEARTVADLADRIKTMKWLMPGEAAEGDVEEREEIEI